VFSNYFYCCNPCRKRKLWSYDLNDTVRWSRCAVCKKPRRVRLVEN
jgi:hypothetical protein